MADWADKPLRFFISRAGNEHDIAWAKWVKHILASHGYTCFLQESDILTGNNFQALIEVELEHTDHLIAILSRAYPRSQYTMQEFRAAYYRDLDGSQRRVIIIRVEPGCTMPDVYSGLVYLDLDEPDEKAARQLLTRILNPPKGFASQAMSDEIGLSKAQILAERLRRQFITRYLDPILDEAAIKIEPPLESDSKSGRKSFTRVDLYQFVSDVKAGSRLLITGNAGAGKSVLLLQCIKSLLPMPRAIESRIPILLNVSTWVDPRKPAAEQQSMREWLRQQIFSQYGIVPTISDELIGNGQLIYCFDDFSSITAIDEGEDRPEAALYRRELRDRFLQELARFLGRHSSGASTGVILTARSEQLDDLKCIEQIEDLDFFRVNVCPLDPADVMRSIQGTDLGLVFELADNNENVRGLLVNPFTLQMLCRVIGQVSSEANKDKLRERASTGRLMEGIYRIFITARLARFVENQREPGTQRRWPNRLLPDGQRRQLTGERLHGYLANLARYLVNRNRLTFRIDELQPQDLPKKVRNQYHWLAAVAFALAIVITAGTVASLATGIEWVALRHDIMLGLRYGFLTFAAVGVLGGGVVAIGYRYLRGFPLGVAVGIAFAIVRGFVVGLSADVPNSPTIGAGVGLRQGFITALISIPVFGWLLHKVSDNPYSIEPIEMYEPDKGRTRSSIAGAVAAGICFWYFLGPARGISFGGLIAIVLITFFARRRSQAPIKIRPNQAIRSSARQAALFASRFTIATSVLFGLVYGYYYGIEEGVNNALLGLGGSILFLFFGGLPVLKHMALRCALGFNHLTPWRLEAFLQDAGEAGLVTQVGAGFTFQGEPIRNYLAEYASASTEWGKPTVAASGEAHHS